MMAMVIDGVFTVSTMLRIGSQELMLTLRRPTRMLDCQQIMAPLHFL
jgi:hypothetical protein